MIRRRLVGSVCLAVMLLFHALPGSAQDRAAIDHARHILDLLKAEQFDDVVKEFNTQVAAQMSATQLRQIWSALQQQTGTFQTITDDRVTPVSGRAVVTLGCQFEKGTLNCIVTFDPDGKIAGFGFTPRTAAPAVSKATPPNSIKEEAVTVGSGEWALPGTLSLPVGRIIAAVVLVHGSGPNDRDETIGPNTPFRDLAWGLASRGIAVLRYEKRTRQYAAKMGRQFTVKEETIDDAVLAASLLRSRREIDPKRVFVLGHSLGAGVAPRIGQQDSALAGLIILAGPTRPTDDVLREQVTYLASITPGSPDVDVTLKQLHDSFPDGWLKDMDSYNPAQTAAMLKMPMLILQGERDYQVSLTDLDGWRSALGSRSDVTIKSYPTLNHLFLPGEGKSTPMEYGRPNKVPDFVIDDIAQWIAKQ